MAAMPHRRDPLTDADRRRLQELVHIDLPRSDAETLCQFLRRIENVDSEELWQHDTELMAVRATRRSLEGSMETSQGDPRLSMTRSRALVLSAWTHRTDSEHRALWTLDSWLEEEKFFEIGSAIQAAGPHGPASWPGYEALLEAARDDVLNEHLNRN